MSHTGDRQTVIPDGPLSGVLCPVFDFESHGLPCTTTLLPTPRRFSWGYKERFSWRRKGQSPRHTVTLQDPHDPALSRTAHCDPPAGFSVSNPSMHTGLTAHGSHGTHDIPFHRLCLAG